MREYNTANKNKSRHNLLYGACVTLEVINAYRPLLLFRKTVITRAFIEGIGSNVMREVIFMMNSDSGKLDATSRWRRCCL